MNDPRFGKRQRGEGPYAQAAEGLFDATVKRLGLNREPWSASARTFHRPGERPQLPLF